MVGSRHPDPGFLPWARRFAAEVAGAGVGVVSGAAEGVDRAAHWGAMDAGEQTWAFLGSALDELDPAQASLAPHLVERGGLLYSELPPGVRASPVTFPRRNRLISGASDVVLVLRAGDGSGSLYTAHAALQQGRPLLALPGEIDNPAARGTNGLIRTGAARLCLGAGDVWRALGMAVQSKGRPPEETGGLAQLSEEARAAYALLASSPQGFEAVLARAQMDSAALTSALCELELRGLVVQHPGKRYEKV
jgi:DNA processing protein